MPDTPDAKKKPELCTNCTKPLVDHKLVEYTPPTWGAKPIVIAKLCPTAIWSPPVTP